jgi:hypothetical protein
MGQKSKQIEAANHAEAEGLGLNKPWTQTFAKFKTLTVFQMFSHIEPNRKKRAFPWYGSSHVSEHAPHA